MKIIPAVKGHSLHLTGCVVAIGNCDGVHLAHQALLNQARKLARRLKTPAVLYTFWPHPAKVLAPHLAPALISTARQKLETLKKINLIDAVLVETFNSAFARMTPEQFFYKVILRRLKARALVVGYDFTFGADRAGNAHVIRKPDLNSADTLTY